jgi:L,D-peptidoglycan transpeptidase YkuD (ErfK/YbiS/YcfS/YnhG family)
MSLKRVGKPKQSSAARRRRVPTVVISGLSAAGSRGVVRLGVLNLPCALGRRGRRTRKREGDGATPVGSWQTLRVLYRADRIRRPMTGLPVKPIGRDDGWCDAPADRNYNRPVRLPYAASAEAVWRADRLYDIVVVLSHNTRPRVRGCGSAVFLHVAKSGYAPTEGCIALRREHLLALLRTLKSAAVIRVLP